MLEAEIRGLQQMQAKVDQVVRDLHGPPMLEGMRRATMMVTTDAKRLAPVDTGRLRSSITPEVRQQGFNVLGVVGSNVLYAAHVELGTKPHEVPIEAVETWAQRHGIDAYLVVRSIKRKGTKARLYMRNAYEKNEPKIKEIIGDAVTGIINT